MRPLRLRFTVRWAMITTAALAAIVAAWVKFDRLRRAPYEAHLQAETQWIQSPSSQFLPDSSGSNMPSTRPCILKISEVGAGSDGGYDTIRLALAQDGTCYSELTVPVSKGVGVSKSMGGQIVLLPAMLADVRRIVAALPPSNAASSRGEFVVVGFLDEGYWTTRSYDKTGLPPDVRTLLTIVQFHLL